MDRMFSARLLARVRRNANLTQRELAELIERSHGLVALYETARRVPPPEVTARLISVFDLG